MLLCLRDALALALGIHAANAFLRILVGFFNCYDLLLPIGTLEAFVDNDGVQLHEATHNDKRYEHIVLKGSEGVIAVQPLLEGAVVSRYH